MAMVWLKDCADAPAENLTVMVVVPPGSTTPRAGETAKFSKLTTPPVSLARRRRRRLVARRLVIHVPKRELELELARVREIEGALLLRVVDERAKVDPTRDDSVARKDRVRRQLDRHDQILQNLSGQDLGELHAQVGVARERQLVLRLEHDLDRLARASGRERALSGRDGQNVAHLCMNSKHKKSSDLISEPTHRTGYSDSAHARADGASAHARADGAHPRVRVRVQAWPCLHATCACLAAHLSHGKWAVAVASS
eukprot:1856961-Pleurochrysis_carterae.AAC.1